MAGVLGEATGFCGIHDGLHVGIRSAAINMIADTVIAQQRTKVGPAALCADVYLHPIRPRHIGQQSPEPRRLALADAVVQGKIATLRMQLVGHGDHRRDPDAPAHEPALAAWVIHDREMVDWL